MLLYALEIFYAGCLMLLVRQTDNRVWKSLFFFFLFLVLFVTVGFRESHVGGDTSTYVSLYHDLRNVTISWTDFFSSRFEPGYLWLNQILYQINSHYSLLLSVFAFLTLAPFMAVIYRESEDAYLSFLIFYGLIFRLTMASIRSALAMALVAVAYSFLKRNRWLLAALFIFLASSFHLSALFMAFMLLAKWDFKPWFKGFLIGIALFLFLGLDKLLQGILGVSKYVYYLQSDLGGSWVEASAKLSVILQCLIFLLVYVFGRFILRKVVLTSQERFLDQLVFLGLLLSFVNIGSSLVSRLTYFFFFFLVLYLPMVISHLSSRRSQLWASLGVAAFFVTYLFSILILRPEWTRISDYSNVLWTSLLGG